MFNWIWWIIIPTTLYLIYLALKDGIRKNRELQKTFDETLDNYWYAKERTRRLHPTFIDCQREIEGTEMCSIQCEHCYEYYKPVYEDRIHANMNQQEDEDNEQTNIQRP